MESNINSEEFIPGLNAPVAFKVGSGKMFNAGAGYNGSARAGKTQGNR